MVICVSLPPSRLIWSLIYETEESDDNVRAMSTLCIVYTYRIGRND